MRDPPERLVSLYNYRRSKGVETGSIETWLDLQAKPSMHNPMTRFYAESLMHVGRIRSSSDHQLPLAKTLLQKCWFVGNTPFLDEDLGPLFSAMGLPCTWKDQRVAGIIQDENNLERELHPAKDERLHRFVELDDRLRKRIYADHPVDKELYDYALQRRQQTLTNLQSLSTAATLPDT